MSNEDKIRADFNKIVFSPYSEGYPVRDVHGAWLVYKACAESYEQKLSEANARNAMLVEVLQYVDDFYCFTNDEEVNEALAANKGR